REIIGSSAEITIAVDTEGSAQYPWGLSVSWRPGQAVVFKSVDAWIAKSLIESSFVVFHNALHDLAVLQALGIVPTRYTDSMMMAYLLCLEPQGLKQLARRHCGMEMQSYPEVVGEADNRIARRYLEDVFDHRECAECEGAGLVLRAGKKKLREKRCDECNGDGTLWPKPEPQLVRDADGKIKEYQAQSLGR